MLRRLVVHDEDTYGGGITDVLMYLVDKKENR
jgi:hypothetical protein